ncbi:RpiR family transcriptional regulator [Gluconobacter frateurii NBRC 101659]|uniref:MurR/RpiR family transcriptional regulator n=1 Tax=Gluconobacter japonicus TaxID=376620 RepID=UPI00029A8ACF|nr:RpiR family transcriptional regulator [Gluconobacter frateurii NBRC 101659]
MTDRYQIFSAELGARYSSLPLRLKQLADLVSSNPDDVAHWTVSVLAQHANVQPSTVVRFTKTFGFKGYSDFQALFRERLRGLASSYPERLQTLRTPDETTHSTIDLLTGFHQAAATSLNTLQEKTDPLALDQAVDILASGRCIHILGLRRSMPVARYFAYLLLKMTIPHQVIGTESGMEEEALLTANSNDAALIISYASYAPKTIELFQKLEQRGIPIVSMTDNKHSPVIPKSGVWLQVSEADFHGFRSNAASVVMVMTLATAIANRRGSL